MDNKNVFAANLRRYMEANGKSRTDISNALNVSYFTVSDWVNGKKYPRMDKVELLANLFGIQKSDLIEDKQQEPTEEETVSPDEQMLLDLFRLVPDEQKDMVLSMIKAALGK